MNEFHRQRDILAPDDLAGLDVDIVGAGALGGAILLCLCKMGCGLRNRVTLTDFDRCESHNLGTQWFRPFDVVLKQPKVRALAEMVAWVCDREIVAVEERFTGDEERPLGPVVILAVDSLDERAAIWRRLRERDDVRLLIDARMGAEVLELHAVDLRDDDRGSYESSLVGDAAAHEDPCTRRAILYTVLGAASFVGSLLRAYARSEPFPRYVAFDFRNFFIERSEPPVAAR